MNKIFFIFVFVMLSNTQPTFSQNNNLQMSVGTAINSKNALGFYNGTRTQNKSNINFNLKYSKRSLSTQLTLNFDDHDKFSFDNSYVNYKKGIANFSIGKVDRIWSFSKKSSLILSSNSRPIEAISLSLENKFNTSWLPSTANWSVEFINGSTKNSLNNKNSMLSGTRIIISPFEKLNFEFLQTAQWGNQNDKLYSSNIDGLLFGNTNEGINAHINKMAGFGLSYSVLLNENTYRFYSQAIGEDEAGNLPSCLSWMLGLGVTAPSMKFPTTITIEAVDTRVKKTTNGNCGQNTMYNNVSYNYINYDTVLGAPIDTEGTSLELFGKSQVSQKINIEYSTKLLTINDKGWSGHRLSSQRETGLINSLGVAWNSNNLKFNVNIYNQDYTLDRADIKNSFGLGFSSSIIF
jgi:hypothetical protein